jgi:chemotaxis-related protein WspD
MNGNDLARPGMDTIIPPATLDCWKRSGIWGDRSCPELKAHRHCRNCPVYSAGASRLLDAAISGEELVRRAAHYATPNAVERVGTLAIVIFRVGAEWLALPTSVWREVATPRPIHSLPHRRDQVVLGVANIRGELLVCVSLAVALGTATAAKTVAARLAVVQLGHERFAFPADEIAGLHRHGTDELTPAPTTLARAQADCTRGMLTWEQRAVGVLDAGRVFQTLNRSLA